MFALPAAIYQPLRSIWRTVLAPKRGTMRSEKRDFALRLPLAPTLISPSAPRIAVICHLFHDDLAGEFRRAIDNLPFADLFISTDTDTKVPSLKAAFASWSKGTVEIRVFPNRGRDIGPKFAGFSYAYSEHELILFLHSKKSLTSELGNEWRHHLLENLAGSRAIVDSIITLFNRYPDLGCVIPQHFRPIRGLVHWDGNYRVGATLAQHMDIALARHHIVDFPSGSMFWARPAALRPLIDLELKFDDFPIEANQVRGTIQHAIERLFLLVCERAGYRWLKVAVHPDDVTPISDPIANVSTLDSLIAQHRFDLLGRQ